MVWAKADTIDAGLWTWLLDDLEKIVNREPSKRKNNSNEDLFDVFCKYANLSSSEAKKALKEGPDNYPRIGFTDLKGDTGLFNPGNPTAVFLNIELEKKFKKNPKKQKLHDLIESTLLHEMVHWGNHHYGTPTIGYTGVPECKEALEDDGLDHEKGKLFECEAYDRDIKKYW